MSRTRWNIYRSDEQFTVEPYGSLRCLCVLSFTHSTFTKCCLTLWISKILLTGTNCGLSFVLSIQFTKYYDCLSFSSLERVQSKPSRNQKVLIQYLSSGNLRILHPALCERLSLFNWQASPKLCLCSSLYKMQDGPLARYVKMRVVHAPVLPGTFSPPPLVSDPDMHQGTYLTHVP